MKDLIPRSLQVSGVTFEQAKDFKMPFGKHEGEPLDDIPLTYLDWLYGECEDPVVSEHLKVYLDDPNVQQDLRDEL